MQRSLNSPAAGWRPMKLAALLTLGALLALAGGASAQELVDLIYENATSLRACAGTSVSGNAGVAFRSDPLGVDVTAPTFDPPGAECLVLPA